MSSSLKQKILSLTLFSSMIIGGAYLSYYSYQKHSALSFTKQDEVLRNDMDSLKNRINYLVEDAPLTEKNLFKDLKKSTYLFKACKLSDNYSSLQEKIAYEKNPSRKGEWEGFGLIVFGLLGLYSSTIKENKILPEPEENPLDNNNNNEV